MKTVLFKFINGEEVIAWLEEEVEDGYIISSPVTIHFQNTPQGMSASLIPTVMGNHNSNIFVPNSAIMMEVENGPSVEIEKKYMEMTSGLVLH